MDTDDLSEKTYSAILTEAEKFNHDLTLQYGLLSYDCKNEEEYIRKALLLTEAIRRSNEFEFESIFFGNPPPKKDLTKTLDKIKRNIEGLG